MTEYRLPNGLSTFQDQMYKHLIDWKREHITNEAGQYAGRTYDAVLPDEMQGKLRNLYEPVRQRFQDHQKSFHFKTHTFADHMASSQIACANLFLPIMECPDEAPGILAAVKPDIDSIATDKLDAGFRIEFWDEPTNLLGDHNKSTGTDSDFAIAYRDRQGDLNLWLIEHKLTEAEFTTCGGARSKGRVAGKHSCESTEEILQDTQQCYYQSACGYNYWDITLNNEDVFPHEDLIQHTGCPFKGGMNQLWRNMLLALAIEDSSDWPYKRVFFSVCHHPKNHALQESMDAFSALLGDPTRFASFTSEPLIERAKSTDSQSLRTWADWYSDLYLF